VQPIRPRRPLHHFSINLRRARCPNWATEGPAMLGNGVVTQPQRVRGRWFPIVRSRSTPWFAQTVLHNKWPPITSPLASDLLPRFHGRGLL
jgi:hypothetical protein